MIIVIIIIKGSKSGADRKIEPGITARSPSQTKHG